MIYRPYAFAFLNDFESLNLGLMTFIVLFLQMTFEDWNPFITFILFASSIVVPFSIYFYLGVKYLVKEKFAEEEEEQQHPQNESP
jgi:hypothetical protein